MSAADEPSVTREPAIASDDDVLTLARDRAELWFPGFRPVAVEIRRVHRKRHSTVHELALRDEDGSVERAFVKQPRGRDEDGGVLRPRSISEPPVGDKARLQADALSDLDRAVKALARTDIGSVQVLDSIDGQLVVLSAAEGDPLREVVLRSVRWRSGSDHDLDAVFWRAGCILRLFHDRVQRPTSPTALSTRGACTEVAETFSDYLAGIASRRSRVRDLGSRLVDQIHRHLPEELALATRFGDFGLTNLLVTPAGTVTPIDTIAAVRTPPLQDATYLLTGLTAIRPQVMTHGLAVPAATSERWQESFWSGYLGDRSLPEGAIAVFTCLRLLERWAAKTTRTASTWQRRGPGAVVDSYLMNLIETSLSAAEASTADHEAVNGLVVRAA